jgi:26S proteasome regulatory subunit N7
MVLNDNVEMGPFYKFLSGYLGWEVDVALLKELEEKNRAAVVVFDEKAEDALQNAGETEYSDALIAKAHYVAKIGEKDVAVQAYDFAIEKTAPIGVKIDLHFAIIRIGFFHRDSQLVHQYIEKVKVYTVT